MCSWVLNYGNNDDVFFLPLLNLNPKKKTKFLFVFLPEKNESVHHCSFFFETEEKDSWLDSCGVINIICSCRFWLFDLIGVVVAFVY